MAVEIRDCAARLWGGGGRGGGWGNPHPKGSASMRDESRVHDT